MMLSAALPANAGQLQDGLAAFKRHDYATAARHLQSPAGASDQVVLESLDIEGLGTGLAGVEINSGAVVYVVRCTIHHFT